MTDTRHRLDARPGHVAGSPGDGNSPAAQAADNRRSRPSEPGPVASSAIDLRGVRPLPHWQGVILSAFAGAALGLVYLEARGLLF